MNLLNFKSFAFIAISIFGVNCNEVSLNHLKVGDVINQPLLNETTFEFIGNLFNEELRRKYVKNKNPLFRDNSSDIYADICQSVEFLDYCSLMIRGASKRLNINDGELTASALGIEDRYFGDYFCIIKQDCFVQKDEFISIDSRDMHNPPDDIKSWVMNSGIFQNWSSDRYETLYFYVSSMITGDCVNQVVVYEKPDDMSVIFDYLEITPIHVGRIFTGGHNETLENWINDFMKNSCQTLLNIDPKNKAKITEQFNNEILMRSHLSQLDKFRPDGEIKIFHNKKKHVPISFDYSRWVKIFNGLMPLVPL